MKTPRATPIALPPYEGAVSKPQLRKLLALASIKEQQSTHQKGGYADTKDALHPHIDTVNQSN